MQATMRKTQKVAYSVAEAVQASSLSRSTIYNLIKAGRLTARRIGGRTIIPAESLTALLEGGATDGI